MKRFVIDNDTGVDDAQAILLAFGQKDVQIEALTTVCGNVGVDKTTANVLKVLDVAGKDVPVYAGCARPMISQPFHAAYVHGEDGLGDAGIPASKRKAEKKHAVRALIDIASEAPGEIGLIALGPLTNLATAVLLDPELPAKFKDLTIMGGAVHGHGNTNITAEFNIYADPEAARIVFDRWPKIRVLSWETTMGHVISKQDIDRFFAMNTAKSNFVKSITQPTLKFIKTAMHQEMLFAADGLATAVAIDPSIISNKEDHYMSVELCGEKSRGMTYVDWFNLGDKPANAEIVLEINQPRFIKMMEAGLK